jgi:hypothetical protein
MKAVISVLVALFIASACTTTPGGPRRTQIRDCPVGMVLICETGRDQQPGSGADEEIPEYDRCYCEDVM